MEDGIRHPSIADHDLLIELRTEMRAVRVDIKDIKDGTTARISALEQTKEDKIEVAKIVAEVEKNLSSLVSKEEFNPIQRLVYGCVGIILTAVIGALVYLVVSH